MLEHKMTVEMREERKGKNILHIHEEMKGMRKRENMNKSERERREFNE